MDERGLVVELPVRGVVRPGRPSGTLPLVLELAPGVPVVELLDPVLWSVPSVPLAPVVAEPLWSVPVAPVVDWLAPTLPCAPADVPLLLEPLPLDPPPLDPPP